jgi:hypothetical protein
VELNLSQPTRRLTELVGGKSQTSQRRSGHLQVSGGEHLTMVVLAATHDDTIVVDLDSGALVRLRVPWPGSYEPDLEAFDIVEVDVAHDPERNDPAHPEAITVSDLPRKVGTFRGRPVRPLLAELAVPHDGSLFGFRGTSAPYWELRGDYPSVALITPNRGPQLLRRRDDDSTWVRFGWGSEDVWMPMDGSIGRRVLDAARRERLAGKELATALGFRPWYLLTGLSKPRDGHCYKVVSALLPRN